MSVSGHPFGPQGTPLDEWLKQCGFIPGETVWRCTAAEMTIADFETAASRGDHVVLHRNTPHELGDVLKLEARNLTGGHPVWKGTLRAPDSTSQDQHILATVKPATGQVVVFLQVINGREDNRANALPRVMECRH